MDQDLHDNLKKFRSIEPDPDYSRRSFHTILNSRKPILLPSPFANVFVRVGFVAAVLVFAVMIAVKSNVPLKIAGLDPQGLQAEAEELDQQLKLTEIASDNVTSTDAALKEVSTAEPGHLNTTILKKEAGKTSSEPKSYSNPEIDNALKALTQ